MENSAHVEFRQTYEIAKADPSVLTSDESRCAALMGAIHAKDLLMVSTLMRLPWGPGEGNPDE